MTGGPAKDVYFGIELEERGDGHVVSLFGELDIAVVEQLVDQLLAADGSTIVVDLRGLTFIDAAGIRGLLDARDEIEGRGHSVTFTHATGPVLRVFNILHLGHLLDGAP